MITKRRWVRIIACICLIIVIVGCLIYNDYRGLNSWNLRIEEVQELKQTIQRVVDCEISVKYRAFQFVEIVCLLEECDEQNMQIVLDKIKNMMIDTGFQKSYATAYAKRYKTENEDSVPEVVIVYFQNDCDLIMESCYSSTTPFTEWYQIK